MPVLKRRFISENHVTRSYPRGGIFLSGSGESLQELSGGKGLEGAELRETP
jgi:hypothetical protein